MIKKIVHIIKTEPFYLYSENITRKLLGYKFVSKEQTVFYRILNYIKQIILFVYKSIHSRYLFSNNEYNIELVFDCAESDFPEKWLNQNKRFRKSLITIKYLVTEKDKKTFFNSLANKSDSKYYIFCDRPILFEKFGLYEIILFIKRHIGINIFYTDHWEKFSRHKKHYCKPSFNLDYYLAYNFIQLPIIISNKALKIISRKSSDDLYKENWIYSLPLKAIESEIKIQRLEYLTAQTLPYSEEQNTSRKQIVAKFLHNQKTDAAIENISEDTFYINRKLYTNKKVAIIIPFKDKFDLIATCVESILSKTIYSSYEILLVSNNSEEQNTFTSIQELIKSHPDKSIHSFEFNYPFNYSEINNWTAKQTDAEYLLFLNNDTQVLNSGWLTNLCKHIQRENVGAVGCLLYYPDSTVQHAGAIVGVGDFAGHAHRHLKNQDSEYMYRVSCEQEMSAVTGACLLTTRHIFNVLEGFNQTDLKISNNDIDYCLRLRKLGFKVIYTPQASMIHFESKTRSKDTSQENIQRYQSELNYMRTNHITIDEFYNSNLSSTQENFQLKNDINTSPEYPYSVKI